MHPRLLLLLPLLVGCSAATNIIEDLTLDKEVPDGVDFVGQTPTDYGRTGIAVSPDTDHVLAPARLVVANRTGGDVVCEVVESDLCDSFEDALDDLRSIPAGGRWEANPVNCALLDIACLAADDAGPEAIPLRAWSWFVEPEGAR